MGEDNKEASTKRTTPEMRKASLLLSGLVLTPDSALEAFRKRRAADPELDEAHLRRARDLLDAVAEALTSTDEAKWQAIERAWNAVAGNAEVGNVPPPQPSTPQPPTAQPAAPQPSAPSSSPVAAPAPPSQESSPAPPPPVGTPLREDQIPKGIAQPTSGPSPWAKPTLQSPVAMPPAPPPSAAPPAPSPSAAPPPAAPPPAAPPPAAPPPAAPPPAAPPPSVAPVSATAAPAINIDVEALNKIKLDSEDAGTLPADAVFASGNRALPFQGQVQPPPSKVAHEARDPLGETTTAFHDIDIVNQTLPFGETGAPASQHDFAPTARLEPVQAADLPTHLSHMTLEQYAALCAECAVSPQWTQQIHARYGIRSPADRQSLDGHWQAHITTDPNVANTYSWHYARYEEWAKSRQG